MTGRAEEPLPERAEVAVVGAGVAGLSAALGLARGGAGVVVLDRAPAPVPEGPWAATVGLAEHPGRLVAAVGRSAAAAILRFSVEGLDLLAEAGHLRRTGGLALAGSPAEVDEVRAGAAVLADLGVPAEVWEAGRAAAALGGEVLVPGAPARFVPAEGAVDADALVADLAGRAERIGVRLLRGAPVIGIEDAPTGVDLVLPGGRLRAEVAVLAAGWSLASLDRWFADKVHPVRERSLRVDGARPGVVATTAHGFCTLAPDDGGATVRGCRFATPDLGVGATDPHEAVPPVEARLADLARALLGKAATPRSAAGHLATHTCDGLPVLGPVPGRPRLVACAGWNGRAAALAPRGAAAVAQGLLEGRADGVPALMRADRFV